MRRIKQIFFLVALVLISACSVTQSRYSWLGKPYQPLAKDAPVDIYKEANPEKPYVKVARLDVHLEKTHFINSDFKDALPELIKQARLAGADAIIEIKERKSSLLTETKIYHVTATGIKYVN